MSENTSFLNNKSVRWIWLILLLAVPIVLWMMPSDTFDEGKVILCPSQFLFAIECYGCGLTRGVMNMHHFDYETALYFNKLSPAVYIGLIILWIVWVKNNLQFLGVFGKKAIR